MSTRLNQSYAQLSTDGFAPVSTTPPSPIQGPPSALDGTLQVGPGPLVAYSVPVFVAGMDYYRFVFAAGASSTLAGTLRLETCCDLVRGNPQTPNANDMQTWIPQAFPVVQVDGSVLLASTFPVAGPAVLALDELRCTYLWVRMRLDLASGQGTPTVRWCLKGDGGR